MIDIDLTSRDLLGNVSFNLKGKSNSGIECLIQKVVVLLLSNSATNYFTKIIGGNLEAMGKITISSIDDDFRMMISTSLLGLKQKIQKSEIAENIPTIYRLKNLEIKDILYDKITGTVVLSILLSTNSETKIIKLPVK